MDRTDNTREFEILRTYAPDGDSAYGPPFAVVESRRGEGRFLAAMLAGDSAEGLIPVPANIDTEAALLAPLLAMAFDVWDELSLELGETAVCTGGGPLAGLVTLAAVYRGACPVIRLACPEETVAGVKSMTISREDTESSVDELRDVFLTRPGTAVVELTGRADMVDVLLESIPRYSRLMLAGGESEPLTVDYYNNMHRSGITVLARRLQAADALLAPQGSRLASQLARAFRILQDPHRAAESTKAHGALAATAGD